MQISAVIPAAGFGTRFLPFTKAIPKEMTPLFNKPAIQYIIEEGIASGIKNFCLIIGRNKEAIANHFDRAPELETTLAERKKTAYLDTINQVMQKANFIYTRQPEARGLGHAVLMAKPCIQDNFFAVLLPDELFMGSTPGIKQLIDISQHHQASVIAVREVPQEKVSSYGIIRIKKEYADGLYEVAELVEKPSPEQAPSNLAIIGRYVLSKNIFSILETTKPSVGNEIQLTDALNTMTQIRAQTGEKVLAYNVTGNRFDIGNPEGWFQALLHLAAQDPVYAQYLKAVSHV